MNLSFLWQSNMTTLSQLDFKHHAPLIGNVDGSALCWFKRSAGGSTET